MPDKTETPQVDPDQFVAECLMLATKLNDFVHWDELHPCVKALLHSALQGLTRTCNWAAEECPQHGIKRPKEIDASWLFLGLAAITLTTWGEAIGTEEPREMTQEDVVRTMFEMCQTIGDGTAELIQEQLLAMLEIAAEHDDKPGQH